MLLELYSGEKVVLSENIINFLSNNKLDTCGPVVEEYYKLLAEFATTHNVCVNELEEAIHCAGIY